MRGVAVTVMAGGILNNDAALFYEPNPFLLPLLQRCPLSTSTSNGVAKSLKTWSLVS